MAKTASALHCKEKYGSSVDSRRKSDWTSASTSSSRPSRWVAHTRGLTPTVESDELSSATPRIDTVLSTLGARRDAETNESSR